MQLGALKECGSSQCIKLLKIVQSVHTFHTTSANAKRDMNMYITNKQTNKKTIYKNILQMHVRHTRHQ